MLDDIEKDIIEDKRKEYQDRKNGIGEIAARKTKEEVENEKDKER